MNKGNLSFIISSLYWLSLIGIIFCMLIGALIISIIFFALLILSTVIKIFIRSSGKNNDVEVKGSNLIFITLLINSLIINFVSVATIGIGCGFGGGGLFCVLLIPISIIAFIVSIKLSRELSKVNSIKKTWLYLLFYFLLNPLGLVLSFIISLI